MSKFSKWKVPPTGGSKGLGPHGAHAGGLDHLFPSAIEQGKISKKPNCQDQQRGEKHA